MANNVLQIKRTSVSGRAANTTTLTNPGELALNMTDGIMYSTNGSVVFQIGANLTSIAVGNTTARFTANTLGAYHTGTVNATSLTVGASFVANTTQVTAAVPVRLNNQQQLRFQTVNSTAYAYMVQQNDDNFVFYTSNTTYGQRAVWSIFANTNTSVFDVAAPLRLSNSLVANGTTGTSGQVLKTNGTTTYWDASGGTGTVTSVATANGLSGGPITSTGTLGVVTGSTLTVNTTGIHVNSVLSVDRLLTSNNGAGTNIGIGDDAWFGDVNVADTVRVVGQQNPNNGYIIFGDANNSIKLGRAGLGPLTYNGDFTATGSSNATTLSVGSSFVANSTRVVIGTAVGLQANGGIGTAGQVLHSNGTTAYWAADDGITSLVAANGLNGGTITSTGTISVLGGSTLTVNATGVHVNTGNLSIATSQLTGDVALGANTSGNYVATISNANGISGSSSAEGGTPTIGVVTGSTLTVNTLGIHVNSNLSIADLTVSGNLTVSGTRTYVNTTTLDIGDNIFTLNADLGAVAPSQDAGIEIMRGTSANVQFIWDETNDRWSTNSQPLAVSSLVAAGALSGVTTAALGNTTITGFANVTTTLQVGTNTATFGTAAYVVANGNVGIGTASPTEKLVLNSAGSVQVATKYINGSTTGVSIGAAADGSAFVYQAAALPFIVYTNASERMRVDAGGNVMVGTTATNNRFLVTYSNPVSVPSAGAGGHGIAIGTVGYGLAGGVRTDGSAYLQSTRWDGTATNYDLLLQPNGGNIGVGVSPSAWNSDYKAFQIGAAASIAGRVGGSNTLDVTSNGFRGADGSWKYIASQPSARFAVDGSVPGFQWYIAATGTAGANISYTQAMTLNSLGQVGIGNTSPAHLLSVQGTAALGNTTITGFANVSTTLQVGGVATFAANANFDSGVLFVDGVNNRVGVGTTTPGSLLHVSRTLADNDWDAITLANKGSWSTAQGKGALINVTDSDTATNTVGKFGIVYDSTSRGAFVIRGLYNSSTYGSSGDVFYVRGDGNVGIGTTTPGYKLEVNGSFAATTKSFVIPHPTKPGMNLRYGSLEGPENGVYVRGRLRAGENTIQLPDYWEGLVDEDTYTVNLTPVGKHQELYVEHIASDHIIVGGENIDCFYTVFAERNDVEKLEVEF